MFDVAENIETVDLLQHAIGHFQRNLAAVTAVRFVAVVFGGIMARRYVDARVTMQVTHRKGQSGCGHQLGVQMSGNAAGRQNTRGLLCKKLGIDPAVVGDCHRTAGFLFIQVIREALGRLSHGVNIHPVGSRAQHAAQAARSKFQIAVKPVVDLLWLIGNVFQLLSQLRVFQRGIAPSLIFCHIRYVPFLSPDQKTLFVSSFYLKTNHRFPPPLTTKKKFPYSNKPFFKSDHLSLE